MALQKLPMILGLIGTGISTAGTLSAGAAEKARFEYEQKVADQKADESIAASQRDAEARHREGRFIASRQRAAVAASGGSVGEDSVLDIMADTASDVDLAARTEMYKGEQQARGYRDASKVAGVNANNAMKSAWINAGANLFSGVSSMYSRFGQQAKKTAPASNVVVPY